jgi:tape measure domain-containing protein
MATTAAELQVVISAETEQLTAGLKSASSQVESFGQSIQQGIGLGTGLAVVQAGIQAIGTAFGAMKSSVIDFNQQLDQSRAVFTRFFEGNQQTAEAFLTTLKGFAATTPFEFKDLSTFAIRLQNANTNANDIIPTLKAIGNAASATGSLSKESVDRITLALTQMQMKGKVSGEEMLQLTEANVPAWNILADATGKPVAQLQKMVSQGQIASDVFVQAFRDMYENAGLMEGASKTLEGALSTVRDVGTQAFAEIGRSVYDLATEGANALAKFLSGEDFQAWLGVAKAAVDTVVGGFRDLLAALAPVGDVIAQAFHQLTSGDLAGAFATIQTALSGVFESILTGAQQLAEHMFGAGANLINEYASGILQGASGALTAVMETVSATIAAFLIGSSPPPEGPLAKIDEGGAATIRAWGDGAKAAAESAVKPAADEIAKNIGGLKVESRDAEASIREIGRAMQDVEHASRDLKFAADDIKDAYGDQIQAIDDQIKGLQSAHDVQRDREKLELNLEEIQLRQAELAAQGDATLRAQLQQRLASLKTSDAERKNAEAMQDASTALAGSEKDRLKAQLDAQKAAQQEQDLRSRLKTAKGDDRQKIQAQLTELQTRKQIAAAEATEREQAASRRVADAQAKRDQLSIQQQLDGLVDKSALAEIKARRDQLALRKEDISLVEQGEKIQREIAMLGLKEQRDELIAQRDALLKPLQDQLDALARQKAVLSEQRQEAQNYKADITAATQAWKDQETAIKSVAKTVKEAVVDKPMLPVDKNFIPDKAAQDAEARAKQVGQNLATALSDGFTSMWDSLVPSAIRDRLQDIGKQLQRDGLPALVQIIGSGLAAAVPVLAAKLADWTSAYLAWSNDVQRRVLAAFTDFQSRYLAWEESVGPLIAQTLVGWTEAFLQWATESGPALLDLWAENIETFLAFLGDQVTLIAGKLLDWATAFIAWVGPVIPDLLTELGKLVAAMVEWMGAHIGDLLDALGRWAVEFVEWVAPKIPPLLEETGKLLIALTGWIITTALPAIIEKLVEWGVAIVAWVAPRIPVLIEEVGKLLGELTGWIVNTAAPAIGEQLLTWARQFVDWIATSVLPALPAALDTITAAIAKWVSETLDGVKRSAGELGAGFVQGIQDGVNGALDGFKRWIDEHLTSALPEWVKTALGIKSPSSVFADIGRSIVDGLIVGLDSKRDELLRKIEELAGARITQDAKAYAGESGGEVSEYIARAAQQRGIDPNIALRVADSEGGSDSKMQVGKFKTGWSFWPFQLHYAMRGMPGVTDPTTGMGDSFTRETGWQPGDVDAWKDSIDYALDAAAKHGWGAWYGAAKAGISNMQGVPGHAAGGWAGLHGPELAWLGERGPEYVIPHDVIASRRASSVQTYRVEIALGGRIAEQIYITGRDLALQRGRA